MGHVFLRCTSIGLCLLCGIGYAAKKPRIGVVTIQDRKGHGLGTAALQSRLLSLIRGAGYDGVTLNFQPAADVEAQARQAQCGYILYTDVVDVHRTAGTQVANAVSASKKRDIWVAEIEFRIFAIDRPQPLLSTSVTGRSGKSRSTKPEAPTPTVSPPASVAEPNLLTDTTPREETARQRKHKSVAVAAALEREVKLVRERLNQPPPDPEK